jgi:hypothetical protein
MTKIFYLELHRASEGTLSRWSRLHLQSLAPTRVKEVDVGQAAGCKNDCRIFITVMKINVVPTPFSGTIIGRRRDRFLSF